MEGVGQYIISVACAALACTISANLAQGNGLVATITKTVTGLVLTFTILQPLTNEKLVFSLPGIGTVYEDAKDIVSQGEAERISAMQQVIKEETEAYIRDKALSLGVEVTVCITVSHEMLPVPVAAHLSGAVSPYAKTRLEKLIVEELAIAKENLSWT